MVVERMISLVFKTLNAIDTAKDTLDTLLGKNGKPNVAAPQRSARPHKVTKPTPARAAAKRSAVPKVTVPQSAVSVRSGKEIESERATKILSDLKAQGKPVIHKNAEVDGKKSLAWVMWALHSAEQAKVEEGISVHDISSLLFHAAKIEIYPINVSRMLHDHEGYIRQVSMEKRTKRYLLTEAGKSLATKPPFPG